MKKIPIAVQVYSVREEAARDFRGTMERVKRMGYDGVELAGLYNNTPGAVRSILTELELPAVSAHVPYLELMGDMDGTIEKYREIGCEYIVVPYLNEELRPGHGRFGEVVENIAKIGRACAEHDVRLLYHNHEFEFVRMPDGRFGLDYLFENVPAELLQTEIDTCWVKVAGLDPAAYITHYSGRAPVVHLKDYVGAQTQNMYELIGLEGKGGQQAGGFEFRPAGAGVQDFGAIIEAAQAAGTRWLVVEQDAHYDKNPMEDIEDSIRYLRQLGV